MNYTEQYFQAGQVLRASQLNAMDAAIKTSMKAALPVQVVLGKTYTSGSGSALSGTHMTIHALGLIPKTDYAIQLFRWSNSRKTWVSLYSDENNDETFGWHFLKGHIKRGTKNNPTLYFTDETPAWMANNGKLKSRWLFTADAGATEYTKHIKIASWIVDAFKPSGDASVGDWSEGQCSLIGIPQGKHKALKFKAGILQKMSNGSFELVGMSDSVLSLYSTGTIYQASVADSELGLVSARISY